MDILREKLDALLRTDLDREVVHSHCIASAVNFPDIEIWHVAFLTTSSPSSPSLFVPVQNNHHPFPTHQK